MSCRRFLASKRDLCDRIASHLADDFCIEILDAIGIAEPQTAPDFALLLHAYKAGVKFKSLKLTIPFGLIYGGTDINEGLSNPETKILIDDLTKRANFRVCFSDDFVDKCTMNWDG